jgi:fused signal recognition particle receptor
VAVVLIVIVVVFVALLAGGLMLVVRRRGRHEVVAGEPPAAAATTVEEAPPTPTVEELEEMLEAPPAPEPIVEAPPEPEAPAPELPAVIEKPRLRDRLGRTRSGFLGAFGRMRGKKIDDETWEELEEALLLADVGMTTTTKLLDAVKTRAKQSSASDPDELVALMRDEVSSLLARDPDAGELHAPAGDTNVWMFVGVNGVGKTTTIGKLASQQVADGHRVVLAAADTFRAAAADQLELWAQRTGGEIVRGQEGADPGSIVFDAMAAASSRNADLVLVDTAGRLHTKVNLMEELKKLRRIVDRTPGACKEVLLVIDASTGQNGLVQAKQFAEAVDVTGIVLTKLDGTAKGGIVLAIQSELGIPVKVVGVGEGIGDLIPFDPSEFAAALFEGDS